MYAAQQLMPVKNAKKIMLIGCFGFLCLLPVYMVSAQPRMHIEKVEAEGLTNYYIKCIAQDKAGFMWFGSEEGLFRYDGYSFLAIKNFPGDPQTICNNNIEFLKAGEDGLLWVGSRGGLSCIDCRTLHIENFPAPQPFTVYSLTSTQADSFYAGTSAGLYQFFKKSRTWKKIESFFPNIFIRSIWQDKKGNLFIGSHQGIYIYNLLTKSSKHFIIQDPPGQKAQTLQVAHRLLEGNHGHLFFSTWNAGLLDMDEGTGKMTVLAAPNLDKSLAEYRGGYDLLAAGNDKIWMANAENGVTVFDTAKKTAESFRIEWDAEKNISNRVYALYKDQSGITWIGTENGIYKNDPHEAYLATFNCFPVRNGKALRPDFVLLCSLKDADGDWWMGSYEGLFLFNPRTDSLTDYSAAAGLLVGFNVFNILQDTAGTIWLTNVNRVVRLQKHKKNGLISFSHKTYTFRSLQSNISTALLDREQHLWLGTNRSGIFSFDPATSGFTAYHADEDLACINKNEIHFFYELPDQSILTGGERTGLVQLYPKQNKFKRVDFFAGGAGNNSYGVNAAVKDENNHLWIGTEGIGLLQTNEQLTKMQQFSIRDGFPSMNITAILPSENDHLYLLTDGGLVDYRPLQKKMTLFDKGSGIRNLYNLSFIMKAEPGLIAIGDMGCIHLYNQSVTGRNLTPPAVSISGFKIFDKAYPFYGNDTVVLNHNQNYFSFDYLALNYTRPSHNMYAYRLEGVDNKWNYAGTRRYASYTNLDEGSYTFKVIASNSEGVWNQSPATLHLIIRPPFWHRWWFYSLLILAIGLLLYLVYYIKRRQLLGKEQLRNKIARDLHDDIGSTLSGINIFSKLALQKLPHDQKTSGELLLRINDRTEKTMEALSDIVWSINTRKDNMDNILSRMREYLGEVIEPLGIQYSFLATAAINQVHLGMEIRKEVYLIFKEAIHNASKYAVCSFIKISLEKENKSIVLTVEDNGKGFDKQGIIPGNGINNMQERAEKIGARLEINSQPNAGTRIRLVFPIT